jgi:cytochrome P450
MADKIGLSDAVSAAPFPQDRTCPYQPPAGYAPLRSTGGPVHPVVLYDGTPAWVVTGYAAARELLWSGRLSADRTNDAFPIISPRMEGIKYQPQSFVGMDPPEHTRHRRMLLPEFSVRSVDAMRPVIGRIVDQYLDDMLAAGPPLDLVTAFSLPVPSRVICDVLGVGYADHDFFQRASQNLVQAESPEQAIGAVMELSGYFEKMITKYLEQPGDGMISRLAVDELAAGSVTRPELIMSVLMLLIGGHETTASMITLSVIALLDNPDQYAAFGAGTVDAKLAVEELLRYLSIADIAGTRVAATDIELGDYLIREDDPVIVVNSLANRDPETFPDPDALDLNRGSRAHIAFGFGQHQCLGQNLARAELEIALPALLRRLPDLRLAIDASQLRLRDGGTVQGVNELPVTWGQL